MADKKFGAYICKGCGIADRLNAGQLERIAKSDGKMNLVKSHDFLCSSDGVAMIQNDIANEQLTHLMIAGCSRRAKTEAFNFDGVAMTRANLREGVIWVRPDTDEARETTQDMADDYIRMACAELKQMNVPIPSGQQEGRLARILVVGGGMSGMTAALEAANAGYEVVLVEKSGTLGGAAAHLFKRIPVRAPYADPQNTGVAEMIQAVESHSKIKVLLNATINKTAGAPGRFAVDISANGASCTEHVGAIVQATGFKPFDKSLLSEFFPACPDVLDQMELEKLVKAANGGAIKRPSDGKEVKSVVFIQCAGQRSEQPGHLSYCSGHCCLTSIKRDRKSVV